MTKPDDRPIVRVKPRDYQPTAAELRQKFVIKGTPEEIARVALTPVRVVEDADA